MLELKKKNIHMDCIKAKAGDQITIEDDVNIPDMRPDIDKVIFQSGVIRIDEVKPGKDQVSVKGSLAVHILYQSEEEDEPYSKIEAELPFDEMFHMDGVESTDAVCIRHETEDLSIGIINSRKISIRAMISLELLVRDIYDEYAAVDMETDLATEYRKKPLSVLETMVCKKDIFRFRHEENLPDQMPNIGEVLYGAVMPMDVECIPEDGRLLIRGSVRVFFLYTSDHDERDHQFYETTIPLQGEISCSGLSGQMIANVAFSVSDVSFEVKDDYDGEDRIFDIEAIFDLDIKAYEEKSYDILADMYCVTKDLQTECKDVRFLQLMSDQQGRTRIKEKLKSPNVKVLNMVHHEENVTLEDIKTDQNCLKIVGNLHMACLYEIEDENEKYCFAEYDLPFVHAVEDIDIQDRDVHPEVCMQIVQSEVTVTDDKSAECDVLVSIRLLLLEEKAERMIADAKVVDFLPARMRNLPGMVIYVVKSGDTLWQIGKEYCISVNDIKKINDLTKDELQEGDRLLLFKNMCEE